MSRFVRTVQSVVVAACSVGCCISAYGQSAPLLGLGGTPPAQQGGGDQPQITGDRRAEATLTMDVRKYDFAGTRAANRMYFPSSAVLSTTKPDGITKEPAYNGTPEYATISLGDGTPNRFVIAVDEAPGHEPKIYLDLNGDGDLTNDGTGDWQKRIDSKTGGLPEYEGTWTFSPGWKTAAGGNEVGQYALNFYWQPGRTQLNYYNASARVGKITLGGKDYDVTLLENDADGNFNKLYDHTKPIVAGDHPSKPVWLYLDGDYYDIRGTFPFAGMNYLATVTDDGSHLTLAPTFRVIEVPRPNMQAAAAVGAGAMAPDFQAIAWNPAQTKVDPANRFRLSDYRGKIVVLDMWATWCGPCMRGIPHLSKVAQEVAGQDVAVIALNSYDDEVPFEYFANGKGKDYKFILAADPAWRDDDKTIAKKLYGVTAIPATFIIDKNGKIVDAISGYSEGDTKIEQELKGLGVKID
ncbi:MAG TPA: TlpA disulfide reductase family protein [Tepidisphaeraceae bacterium]|nr:TlpA disulfide reductase family protein [Tepidisphaeraceae bacterium]